MKRALFASWVLFVTVLATGSIAEDFLQRDFVNNFETFMVKRLDNHRLEYVVFLDDAEIERIKEACR